MKESISKPICKVPASIAAYKKYGINKSAMQFILTNFSSVPMQFRDMLDSYYLLYWEPKYLLNQVKEGKLLRNGISYQVIWHKCTPAGIKNYSQVLISFRETKVEFDIPAYVLVTPLRGNAE